MIGTRPFCEVGEEEEGAGGWRAEGRAGAVRDARAADM